MCRIKLTDTFEDIIVKMSEGNHGAMAAMADLYKKTPKIDPQAFMGGVGNIMALDTYEVYGSSIYIIYNDKCERDARKMCVLLRGVQLGFFSTIKLQQMASDQMSKFNLTPEEWKDLDKKVCDRLEEFQKPINTAEN